MKKKMLTMSKTIYQVSSVWVIDTVAESGCLFLPQALLFSRVIKIGVLPLPKIFQHAQRVCVWLLTSLEDREILAPPLIIFLLQVAEVRVYSERGLETMVGWNYVMPLNKISHLLLILSIMAATHGLMNFQCFLLIQLCVGQQGPHGWCHLSQY